FLLYIFGILSTRNSGYPKFVGPTIVYAFMQATGMVNDHLTTCPRHRDLS
ncbi:DNA-3-methyladenine glycosylase I, partial [Alcanivorax jadensis]